VDVPLKGRIAFDVPDRMRQGEAVTAVVRITRIELGGLVLSEPVVRALQMGSIHRTGSDSR
jgi:hypothetical protein